MTAHVSQTATDYRDLVQKIATFLTTNATLVADGEEWTKLRHWYDNVASSSTDLSVSQGPVDRLFRPEIKGEPDGAETSTTFSGFVAGKYIQWTLRTASAVTKLLLRAPTSSASSQMPTQFRLQYADNIAGPWTTAYTQSSTKPWTNSEEAEFSGWAATGSHLYWRLVLDALGSGTNVAISSILCYSGSDIINSSCEEIVMRGQGLAGTDEIYFAMRTMYTLSSSTYFVQMVGLTGFTAAERRIWNQPGADPTGVPSVPLWDASMTLWMTANGRAIVFCALVSSVYEHGAAGFFDPDTLPTEYPYPLFVGGSHHATPNSYKYDDVSGQHAAYFGPCVNTSAPNGSTIYDRCSLKILDPGGTWVGVSGRSGTDSFPGEGSFNASILPHAFASWRPGVNIGGGYTMFPALIYHRLPAPAKYLGQLPLLKLISGSGNGSQNTGTFGGTPFIIFQNTFRTAEREYMAMVAG